MNREAETWSQIYRDGRDFRTVPYESIMRFLSFVRPSETPRHALDIGCGTGQLTRELAQSHFTVTGIDFSDAAIHLAESAAEACHVTNATYLTFDIEHDDVTLLPGQPYALVTCKLVFAFIEHKGHFLDAVRSLLQPDGVFVIITPIIGRSSASPHIAVDREHTLDALAEHFNVEVYDKDGLAYFVSTLRQSRESSG